MYVGILPAKIGGSRWAETEKFDQARCEHRKTVLEINRRDSIRTICLPRVKASKGTRNTITKDFNIR